MKELGLSRVSEINCDVGFSGTEVVYETFVRTPAPHKGVLAHIKPIDAQSLDMVDGRVMSAAVSNLDMKGLVTGAERCMSGRRRLWQ